MKTLFLIRDQGKFRSRQLTKGIPNRGNPLTRTSPNRPITMIAFIATITCFRHPNPATKITLKVASPKKRRQPPLATRLPKTDLIIPNRRIAYRCKIQLGVHLFRQFKQRLGDFDGMVEHVKMPTHQFGMGPALSFSKHRKPPVGFAK